MVSVVGDPKQFWVLFGEWNPAFRRGGWFPQFTLDSSRRLASAGLATTRVRVKREYLN